MKGILRSICFSSIFVMSCGQSAAEQSETESNNEIVLLDCRCVKVDGSARCTGGGRVVNLTEWLALAENGDEKLENDRTWEYWREGQNILKRRFELVTRYEGKEVGYEEREETLNRLSGNLQVNSSGVDFLDQEPFYREWVFECSIAERRF